MIDDPLIGRQLANFRLERVLGRGGMAQVYYGWDVKLERPVAIKVIDSRFRSDPAYAQRFVREAQAVSTWRHENIAQVYYADEEGDLYYFAMEYVDGLDLGQLMSQYTAKNELMPQADIVRIGRAVASALDYAHSKEVIHRDVKPSNVMVSHDDHVVLMDFGLALDVQQGSMGEAFGTAHYISPEQARRSADAVPQSDLYSLGIMLYELLTGAVPFDDPSPTAVALQHITQPPPAPSALNPDLDVEIEAVLLKALSKSPQDRYQTGDELMTALENALHVGSEVDNRAPLPPLPAGINPPAQAARFSRMTVSEVIASQAHPPAVPSVKTPPASQASQTSQPKSPANKAPLRQRLSALPRRQLILGFVLGGCAVASIVIVIVAGFLFATPLKAFFQNSPQPADASATSLPASPVVDLSNIFSQPTDSATATTVATGAPTETPVPASPAIVTTPTVKYPNGKQFMLLYNDNSLYFINLSQADVPINWISFERLSDQDVPLNRFDGTAWAKYYATSLPNRCMALQILGGSPYLEPTECGHNNFLSLRTPTRDDSGIFWTTAEGSHQFRVLWREGGQDEEIARCEIGAGTCEVFLP